MEHERKPKERVIFDASHYLEPEGIEEAFCNIMDSFGLTEEEVWEQYDDAGLAEHSLGLRDYDFEMEAAALDSYLVGSSLIISGTIERWDGMRGGFSVFDDLEGLLYGSDSPFADCEIQKVWDENGHLFIHGAHHDGGVTVEMRQLTDSGIEAYEVIKEVADAWVDDPFTVAGKHYDGSEQSVIEALRDLWGNSALVQTPRYMERAYGCPAEEWALATLPIESITFENEICDYHNLLNFYIPVTFDVDAVFGTNVCTFENDDWLNVYANYDMKAGEVTDHLELSLNRSNGDIECLTYPLDAEQRAALCEKMNAYCLERTNKSLEEYSREVLAEEGPDGPLRLAEASKDSREASQALSGHEGATAPSRDTR